MTGLAVSARHPYMFSCGLDKTVKCWDLEQNKASARCAVICSASMGSITNTFGLQIE